ncbi:Pectate lyase family protein [Perilla frutescens var. hirtella]|uniref:Pectate lyase n=1 Tax=Perilla frutescens var. hirtella TaxID=608512 RepID=A0AAD4IVF5_PERFH|nr:Pectate lyase family protein [Perilla frutescens var. hirtella]
MQMDWVIVFVSFASILGVLNANIGEWDEVWLKRQAEAMNRTLETYEPIPEHVVTHLNVNTKRSLKEIEEESMMSNSTRRHLQKGYTGPCMVTNPIDRCWRCHQNWAENRFRLADCVLGFGYKTTGGKNGRIYTVTDPSDGDLINPKPGTLRHAVIQKEPLWIIFDRSMVITLQQEMIMQSDKTIDGRGVRVDIAYGAGITIQFVSNVIIHGIRVHDIVSKSGGMIRDSVDHFGFRTVSDGDGISLFGAQNVWIDHVSMTNAADGLIDAIEGSTGVTISNTHFTDHNETLLFGARDSSTYDEKMQITVAYNHFGKRLVQRMPRCRFGYFHVVNNDYTHWIMYAIGGSSHPTIISQGNRYSADHPFAKQVTKREVTPESEWMKWTWVSEGDLFLRGAYFIASGDKDWTKKHPELYDKIMAAPATKVAELTKFAGTMDKGKNEATTSTPPSDDLKSSSVPPQWDAKYQYEVFSKHFKKQQQALSNKLDSLVHQFERINTRPTIMQPVRGPVRRNEHQEEPVEESYAEESSEAEYEPPQRGRG